MLRGEARWTRESEKGRARSAIADGINPREKLIMCLVTKGG